MEFDNFCYVNCVLGAHMKYMAQRKLHERIVFFWVYFGYKIICNVYFYVYWIFSNQIDFRIERLVSAPCVDI